MMSRGTYSGGHTVIKADGSFGSYDPAENRDFAKPVRKKKPKQASKVAKSPKKTKPVKTLSLVEQRKALLNAAADARVALRPPGMKFPKNIGDEVKRDVARIGTIEDWAAKQVGFAELVRKKKEKKKAKGKVKEAVAPAKEAPAKIISAEGNPVLSDTKSRIARLTSEISQAKEFIRLAEKEIERLRGASDEL